MGFNIKELKRNLIWFKDLDTILIDGKQPKGLQNLSNGTLYISTTPKIGRCKKCFHIVYNLDTYHGQKYVGYCPECKANKIESEIYLCK